MNAITSRFDFVQTFLNTLWDQPRQYWRHLAEKPDFFGHIGWAAVILLVTLVVANMASNAVRRAARRLVHKDGDRTLLEFFSQIVRWLVLIFGLVMCLNRLGVQTASLLTVLGAASLAIGLALQNTLSNVAAGLMILLNKPYRIGDVVLGSLGRVVEGYEARVCDDEGLPLPDGEVGTLWVRGGSIAIEYWHNRDLSLRTFRGEWCVSQDKFTRDAQGYFRFCGRGDDMLKVGGKWLSPLEVENCLLAHPAVKEAAVVGFKDAEGLEKPRAFVVLQPGETSGEPLAKALQDHVKAHLAPYKYPREVRFIDALPRSDRGKVLKGQLRG